MFVVEDFVGSGANLVAEIKTVGLFGKFADFVVVRKKC